MTHEEMRAKADALIVAGQGSAIDGAALWLATEPNPTHPIVPALRRRFGLSPTEACQAIREAALIRGRAH